MMGTNFTPHPEYMNLPAAIRFSISEEQYSWMDDKTRASLEDTECMPDDSEDDVE